MRKIYNILLFIIIFATVSLSGCTSIAIRTSIDINAPKEKVYEVLSDLNNYPNWNPYHRKVEGTFEEGAKLNVYVTRPDGQQVDVPPKMMTIIENEEITWGGGIKGIFYGVHTFRLESKSKGKTILYHNEDFSGIAVGFVDLPPDVLAEGYQNMNRALKSYIEKNK